MENILYKKRHLKTVSLFSGAGGKDYGFLNAGFDIIWANDIDKDAVKTYEANIGKHIVSGDLRDYIEEIPKHDVLIGGFPCQPFSMMGEKKGFEDERGTLFFAIEEILKKHDTKIIVLENVRNLLTHNNGETFKVMKGILEEKLGYKIYVQILNTSDYGVPQTRRRAIIVGFKRNYFKNINFEFPAKEELKLNMQNLLDKDVDKKYFLSEKILKTVMASGTKTYKAKAEIDLKVARPLTATMHKMHRASQDNYVTDKINRSKFENNEKAISSIRRLTPNECRKLQGFPSDWKQVVSDTQAYRQFGNAVTVDLAYKLAEKIKESIGLKENLKSREINQLDYSLYYHLNSNLTTSNKKELKVVLENLKNTICEIYSISRSTIIKFDIEDENLNFFLKKVGIINEEFSIKALKNILKLNFKNFISVIIKFLELNIQEIDYDFNVKRFFDYHRLEELEKALKSDSPKFVDLFCGSGGLSLGFSQEGFRPILANDIEEACGKTYRFNHMDISQKNVIIGDIKEISQNITNYIKEEVDLVLGGPPCQSFSMANRQRVIDDPRNFLYKNYVEVIEKTKPKFFVMENVKGMLDVAEQVKEDFHNLEEVDYEVDYKIFNSKDFGVPQSRERLIYIGVRKDIGNRISKSPQEIIKEVILNSQKADLRVLNDAINDLKILEPFRIKNSTEKDTEESGKKIQKRQNQNSVSSYVKEINNGKENPLIFNHKTRFNNDRDIEIFGLMNPGDKSDDEKIAHIMPYKSRAHVFKDKYYKLIPNKVCKTITAHMKFDCNMYIHPNQARGLTPREAARVQSYPDDYFFLGPYTKTYMQIGNSVPPLMARYFAKVIKKYL